MNELHPLSIFPPRLEAIMTSLCFPRSRRSPQQVVGWKYVRLFAPSETTRLYPHTEGLCTNSSRVDFHRPDASAYPLFADAAAQEALLGPGDALFIPRGWWHFVMACSPSASVSFWWS